MSPEMTTGESFQPVGVDIWACGVTLFMFLTGTVPFKAPNLPLLYEAIQVPPPTVE